MVGLCDGEKIVKIYLFVLTESTNVTDTQTDTPHRHHMMAKAVLDASIAQQKLLYCNISIKNPQI